MLGRCFLLGGLAVAALACSDEGPKPPDDSEDGGGRPGDGDGDGDGSGASEMGGAAAGVGGESSENPREDPVVAPVEFSCDESRVSPSPGMRRLTKRQYENTLRDLLALRLGADDAGEVLQQIAPTIALLPEDQRAVLPEDLHGSYRRLDQTIQQAHVDYWYEAAVELGKALSQSQYLETLVGECASDTDEEDAEDCLEEFVRTFGAATFRRPLSDDEVQHHVGFYAPSIGIDPVGFADVIGGLLTAPQFLYQIEHAEEAVEGLADTFNLGAYELASRLSYHFWGTMPDARLMGLAQTGELLDSGTYEAEVERLWDDERTHATLRNFFEEWMKLDDVPSMSRNNFSNIFQNFAGEDLPSDELTDAMKDEVVEMLDYFTWQQPGGLEQIFTTNYSFTTNDELAGLYGLSAWDGESEPPSFDEGRPGILTRAAFLATGTANTRPIMKGVFIRRNILCDKISPPPADAMGSPPELDPLMSTREVVEELTETSPGCAGCHTSLINPLGFATEAFDGLGRFRESQQLFDAEGELSGQTALNTQSVPQIIDEDESVSEGPEDLMTLIVDSGKLNACAARHYFRFTFGRWEQVVSDGCVLEEMRQALLETGSLAGMLRSVALTDSFRRRTFNFDAANAEGDN